MAVTWTSKISDVADRQLPFAIAQTLNALAQGAALDARQVASVQMNITRKSMLNAFIRAPADKRATKTKFRARVVVAAPKSAPSIRGEILASHESGGSRTPLSGSSVALPSRDIKRGGGKRKLISGTQLKNFRPFYSDVKSREVRGAKGSFFITLRKGKAAGKRMLLQRYGRGSKSVRGLWIFVDQTRLTPKLRFNATVKSHVQKNLTSAFKASFSRALASAKPLKFTTQSTRI